MSLIMRCDPCGKSFTGPVSYGQHVESEKHKKKVSSLNILSNSSEKKALHSSEIVPPNSLEQSRDLLECTTCSLRFNTFEDFQTHSLSTEHAKRIIENAQMNVESSNNMVSLLKHSSAHSNNVGSNSNEISDTILPEVEMFKSQASFSFCNTCKKSFSGPESYKQHIESAGHIKKTDLERKISSGINLATPECSCVPCNKTFSGPVPYDQHMNSDTHRKKIQSLQLLEKCEVDSNLNVNTTGLEPGPMKENPWYCKTCDIICSGPAPFEQHNKGVTHLKNLLKAQREKGTDNVLCSSLQINGFNMSKKDIVLSGLVDNNEDAHIAKLDESITVFLPEEEIDFDEKNSETNLKSAEPVNDIDSDEQNNKTNLKSVEPAEIDSDEQDNKTKLKLEEPAEIDFEEQNKTNLKLAYKNSDELELIQITLDACSLTTEGEENISENIIEEKSGVFEICNYCNVKLYNKDEVMKHFESLEHFHRRWN